MFNECEEEKDVFSPSPSTLKMKIMILISDVMQVKTA